MWLELAWSEEHACTFGTKLVDRAAERRAAGER